MIDYNKIFENVMSEIESEFPESDPIAKLSKTISMVATKAAIKVLKEYEKQKSTED